MAQMPRHMQTMQQILKENAFQIIKSMTKDNMPFYIAYVRTFFRQAKNYVGQVNFMKYLPSMVS